MGGSLNVCLCGIYGIYLRLRVVPTLTLVRQAADSSIL